MKQIPLSTIGTDEFTPPTLFNKDLPASEQTVKIFLHIPSFHQRDIIGSLLFSHGLIPVTPEQGQSVLVSELYEFEPEEKADELAGFLEGYWQRQTIWSNMLEIWQAQERARQTDILEGAKEEDVSPNPFPEMPFTARERAKANAIALDIMAKSEHYRRLQGKFGDYQAEEDLMMFRIFVADWTGFQTAQDRDISGKLTAACVEALRAELGADRQSNVFGEIVGRIRSNFYLDGETRKNSESPLGIDSSPSGLQTQTGE